MINLNDTQYWFKPITWVKHRGKHIACGVCISDLHSGYRDARPGAAVQKRISGQAQVRRDLWLCYAHAQEFRDHQTNTRK